MLKKPGYIKEDPNSQVLKMHNPKWQLIHLINVHSKVFYGVFPQTEKHLLLFSGEEYFFEIAEAVFVGWFSFEYVVRFIAAPHKSK